MFSWEELVKEARRAPLPAPVFRALSLSQWALESDWGTSALARDYGNYAGLKFDPALQDIAVPVSFDPGSGQDLYCSFCTPHDFIAAYWRSTQLVSAASADSGSADAPTFTKFLAARGLADDSPYVEKLIALLPRASGLLQQDAASSQTEMARPSRAASGEWIGDHLTAADAPSLKTITSVSHTFRGMRRQGLCGAILRFDNGRTRPQNRDEDLEWGAANTLGWGQQQGLAFITIARDGTILVPSNFDWELWGFHAGPGKCAQTGRTDLSEHYIGIEINGPAQLYPTPDPDCFVPWFNASRDHQGQVRLNIYGEARCISRTDEWYRREQVAIIPDAHSSLRAGVYAPVTTEQELALRTLLIWLKRTFPATFRLENIISTSEILKNVCNDDDTGFGFVTAGKKLISARTMQDFRQMLKLQWSAQQALMAKSYFPATY